MNIIIRSGQTFSPIGDLTLIGKGDLLVVKDKNNPNKVCIHVVKENNLTHAEVLTADAEGYSHDQIIAVMSPDKS